MFSASAAGAATTYCLCGRLLAATASCAPTACYNVQGSALCIIYWRCSADVIICAFLFFGEKKGAPKKRTPEERSPPDHPLRGEVSPWHPLLLQAGSVERRLCKLLHCCYRLHLRPCDRRACGAFTRTPEVTHAALGAIDSANLAPCGNSRRPLVGGWRGLNKSCLLCCKVCHSCEDASNIWGTHTI